MTTSHYAYISRKKSSLTQKDIATLLDLQDPSTISRWEQGERDIPFSALLLYHCLFDLPLNHYMQGQINQTRDNLKEQIPHLLFELMTQEVNPRLERRIKYLQSTLEKL